MHRSAMTLTNVTYDPAFTWASGSVVTLERPMEQPLFNEHPLEMGLKRDDAELLASFNDEQSYSAAFRESFPKEAAPITIRNLVKAIASFERTLISGRRRSIATFTTMTVPHSPKARDGACACSIRIAAAVRTVTSA